MEKEKRPEEHREHRTVFNSSRIGALNRTDRDFLSARYRFANANMYSVLRSVFADLDIVFFDIGIVVLQLQRYVHPYILRMIFHIPFSLHNIAHFGRAFSGMKVCDWYCIWSFCLFCSFWRHPSVCLHQDIRNLRQPDLHLRKADQELPWHPPHLQLSPWHDAPVRFPRPHRYAPCIRNATDCLFCRMRFRISLLFLVLCGGRCSNQSGIHDRSFFQNEPSFFKNFHNLCKDFFLNAVFLQKISESADGIPIRYFIWWCYSAKLRERAAVNDFCHNAHICKIIEILQYWYRTSSVLSLPQNFSRCGWILGAYSR